MPLTALLAKESANLTSPSGGESQARQCHHHIRYALAALQITVTEVDAKPPRLSWSAPFRLEAPLSFVGKASLVTGTSSPRATPCAARHVGGLIAAGCSTE